MKKTTKKLHLNRETLRGLEENADLLKAAGGGITDKCETNFGLTCTDMQSAAC